MSKAINNRRIYLLFFNLLLFCLFFVLFIAVWQGIFDSDNWAFNCSILSLVALGANLYYLLRNKHSVGDFRVVYLLMTYMFMFGRVWIAALGMERLTSWWLQDSFLPMNLYKASMFCLCCTQASFLGLFLSSDLDEDCYNPFLSSRNSNEVNDSRRLFTTGIILLAISIPCRLITDINSIIQGLGTRQYGSIEGMTGLWDDFAFLIIPGVICMMESRPNSRKKWLLGVCIYYASVMLMTGDRRYFAAGLLALGMYYLNTMRKKKKIGIIRRIIYIILIVFGLNFLEVVRLIRNGQLGSLGYFFSNYGSKLFDFSTTFVDVFGEFGISFYAAASIVELVPRILPFQFGLSIIGSMVTILPFGDSLTFEAVEPSTIINRYTHLSLGSSIFGDLYANFGLFSIIFALLLGVVLRKWVFHLARKKTGIYVVLYYTSAYILINLVRCSFREILRPITWCIMIPLVIYRLLHRHRRVLE